jgi:hypothetical protein
MLALLVLLMGLSVQGYDIVIGGGSLSALAAAITAAQNSSNSTKILLIEPTDWPGGQLTASNVPPDFSAANFSPQNLPASFVDLLLKVAGPTWSSNPGKCWVSYKCFETYRAAEYIKQWLGKFGNLDVIYNAVIKSAKAVDLGNNLKRISEITVIQRTAKKLGYGKLFSQSVQDWYSPKDSQDFTKKVIKYDNFKVVIKATEFGDIIATSGIDFAQGIESPNELSESTISNCGQSIVFPFYMSISNSSEGTLTNVPIGSDGGTHFANSSLPWSKLWSYRRVRADPLQSPSLFAFGEQSNINADNDYKSGYLFLPIDQVKKEIADWKGGLNIQTLSNAENRAYAYYHYMVSIAPNDVKPHLRLNASQVGTSHGLSKVPYLRDSRRIHYGLDGFRLTYVDLNFSNPTDGGRTARNFPDVVGIGSYHYADSHNLLPGVCNPEIPSYANGDKHRIKPYYIPFRALTSNEAVNLLTSGKGMAQTFLANAGTRVHPTEFSSGVAAGAAAALMVTEGWNSTRAVYNNIQTLQLLLAGSNSFATNPLIWTNLATH